MKLTIFFFLILLAGIFLIKEHFFIQNSNLAFFGAIAVLFSSIVGLPFSIAQQIKEAFNLTYKQKDYFVIGIILFLITTLSLINKYYSEHQELKLQKSNQMTFTKVDSVKYEERGKLAPSLYFYYSYTVNGQEYHFSKKNDEPFETWQKIRVKYDPENPANHEIIK